MKPLNDTAHKNLDVAEHFTQSLGFNAFSYKDIQENVGIKTSSIHYYFPTKHDLVTAMTERYTEKFGAALEEISANEENGIQMLESLGALYINVLKEGKFCMCGMLASDLKSLPEQATDKLRQFFMLNELFIVEAINKAITQGEIRDSVDVKKSASLFLALLEGGMLIARTQEDTGYLEATIKQAINLRRG